ncbi:MAG: murein biosynthesis integral membrane protein MurJ [Planctomycetota bacterium]
MARQEGIRRFRRAAAGIAGWTLASRVLGLVRDRLMFTTFGRGPESSAFWLAWTVPNLFRRLLGEGALSAVFVPVLTRRLERDGAAGARRSLATVLGALLLVLGVLVVLGAAAVLVMPAAWLARDGDLRYAAHLRELLLVLLPYMLPICVVALASAAQNVSGRFALPALAPFVLNLFWIAALLVAGGGERSLADQAVLVGVALVVGGLFQVLLQLPGLRRSELLVAPRLDLGDPDLRDTAKGMLPMLLGLSVVQLNVLANQVLAVYLVPETGANSVLFLANRLLEFPHALVGIALGTAVFPLLSSLGDQRDREGLGRTLDQALSLGLVVAVPAAVGLLALAPEIVDVLFVAGRFTAADGLEAAGVTGILALSLPALVAIQVLARAHYALGDRRTPVRISITMFALALVANLVLAPRFGVRALAATSTVSVTGNAALLLWSMRRRLPPARRRAWRALGVAVLASVPMVVTARLAADRCAALVGGGGLPARLAVALLVPIGAAALVYLGAARLLGADELRLRRR